MSVASKSPEGWEPVIGLEIHVELDTETKMFCSCAVTKGDRPNTHTCPVCLAHPGALPVVNQRAVEYAARIALALDCRLLRRTVFHRKNYFYPDLPKAYQISQLDEPLAVDGSFAYWSGDDQLCCRINRVHMEEDAAKLVHAGGEAGRIAGLRLLHGRLQSWRDPSHRDRHRARHPVAGRGPRPPAAAA